MNPRETAMDLLERYLHQVGEELPRVQREDVKAELRSLLAEQLDERIAAGEAADGAAVKLLLSFGRPREVAARYSPAGQYLIGPRLFPYFRLLARITLYLVTGVFLAGSVFGVVTGNTHLPEFLRAQSLLLWVGQLVRLLAVNLALLVIVFAALERILDAQPAAPPSEPQKWDPRDLPPVVTEAADGKISEPGLIGKIYAIVVLAVILNFYPQWFGILFFNRNEVLSIPYPALGIYLPVYLLNVWWAGAICLNLWLLAQRHWSRETRWLQLVLNIFGAILLFLVIRASSFEIDVDWVAAQQSLVPGRFLEAWNRGLPWFGNVLRFTLAVMLIATVIEALVRFVRILRRYPLF